MPSTEILIRAIEISDAAAFARINGQESVAAMTLQMPYQRVDEVQQKLVPSPQQRTLVAEIGGEVVGIAGLTILGRRQTHIGAIGMGVDEHAQGRGVGTVLLQALLDLADNWYNLRRLQLEVYVDNAIAIRLYEKHGFEIEGTHRAFALRRGQFVDAYSMARLREGPLIFDDQRR